MAGRKEHVTRIFGREKGNPDDLEDTYIDLRRAHELEFVDPGTGQATVVQIAWEDGFEGVEPDDADRKIRTIKLTDPENPPENKDDPDRWIPVPVVDAATVKGFLQGPLYSLIHSEPDASFENVLSFENDPELEIGDLSREVRPLRVTFADTPGLDERLKEGPIPLDDYERDEDSRDTSQYVDAELIDSYEVRNVAQVTVVELDHQDDERLDPFEPTPDDRPQKPLRLDPYQFPLNVKWGGDILVLVQVIGGGGFVSATRSVCKSAHGDPVGTDISIVTDAKILYQRKDVIDDDPAFTTDKVVVWADTPGGPDSGLVTVVDGYSVSAQGTLVDGTLTGVAVGFFDATDTAAVTSFFAAHPTPAWNQHGPEAVTVHSTYVEAVFLLDNPKEFTVTNSGFPVNVQAFAYPKQMVKVDATNSAWGNGGNENSAQGTPNPGERVWFPINWKKPVPPYPKSPGVDRDWPWPEGNFQIRPPPENKDVINLAMFWTVYDADGLTPSYPFKVEKKEHWSSPAAKPIDPTLADKIWQIYPTRVDPIDEIYNIENNWYVFGYTCVPLGEAFFGPEAWGLPTRLTAPGPLPKIPPETAGF